MDKDSFIVYKKADDIKTLQKMFETRFDTSNHELDWPLQKEKSNWITERWIRQNYDKICWTKSKNL